MANCRRDTLWQNMLLPNPNPDDSPYPGNAPTSRRKHRSGWSTAQPSGDLDVVSRRHQRVTASSAFDDFDEMLTMVEQVRLTEFDATLAPLTRMPLAWFRSLQRAIINKYKYVSPRFLSFPLSILRVIYIMMFIFALSGRRTVCSRAAIRASNILSSQTRRVLTCVCW